MTAANSEEFDKNANHQVVINMPEISTTHLGGTMRLGLRPTIFQDGTESWSKIRKLEVHKFQKISFFDIEILFMVY